MKANHLIYVVLIMCGFGLFIPAIQAQEFDRDAFLVGLVNEVILPFHQTLAQQAQTLEATAITFHTTPNEATLSDLRLAWEQTSIAYEKTQLFRFNRIMHLMNQIDSTPANYDSIETHITDQPYGEINAVFMEAQGSSSKGLSALEYLIFQEDSLIKLTQNPNRRDYVLAITTDLHRVTEELLGEWTLNQGGFGDAFVGANGSADNVRGSLSMTVNEMIALLEEIANERLATPLGYKSGGMIKPEDVEAPFSGQSIAKLIANLEGLQTALNGGDAPSLADYMDYLNTTYHDQSLSDVFNLQLDLAIKSLEAIDDRPLELLLETEPMLVSEAYDDVVDVLRLVKTDVANQLGVTVTFTDADGD